MIPKILKLWHNTKAILKIDDKPTKGSKNLVTSDGIAKGIEDSLSDLIGGASANYNTLGKIEERIGYYVNQLTPMIVNVSELNGHFISDKTWLQIDGARNMFRDVVVHFDHNIYILQHEDSKSEDDFVFTNVRVDENVTITSSIYISQAGPVTHLTRSLS